MDTPIDDPYKTCERGQCNHDLARAVGIAELWGTDGPFPPSHLVVSLGDHRPALFTDDEEPVSQQQWAV